MTPIYFVKYFEKGSTVMGADQMAEGLAARGLPAVSIPVRELPTVRDAVVVFIKRADAVDLVRSRRAGNQAVLDLHDTLVERRRIRYRSLWDGFIFRNARQLADHAPRRGAWSELIYHQWDPRYRPHEAGEEVLRLAYLGLPRSLALWGDLPGVDFVSTDYFTRALDYNAHLSLRRPGREFLYKANCKVSTAAACRAVLLSTRDASTVELLGEDYPFYTEPDRGSVLAAVEDLRRSVGGPRWRLARERLDRVRDETSIERILDRYEELLVRRRRAA